MPPPGYITARRYAEITSLAPRTARERLLEGVRNGTVIMQPFIAEVAKGKRLLISHYKLKKGAGM
jgi:hypothetical protein